MTAAAAGLDSHQMVVPTSGDVRLNVCIWRGPEQPRANVLIVHGHGEHSGRYAHVAGILSDRGIAPFGFDLRGHGRSSGVRAFVRSFSDLENDLARVISALVPQFGRRPVYLLGHSLGGLLVLRYALRRDSRIDGFAASGPFVLNALNVPRPIRALAPLISRFFPRLPTLSIRNKPMTHDAERSRSGREDPLSYRGRVRARTGFVMENAGADLIHKAHLITQPIYIFHGTADVLADWRGSMQLFGLLASTHKTLTLYRGLYHETLNEVGREAIIHTLVAWLDEHRAELEMNRYRDP